MYESTKGYWEGEEEENEEDIYADIEEHRKQMNSYLFPDTEKIGCIHIHYSKKCNGSFVKYLKEKSTIFFDNYKYYKTNLVTNATPDSDITNVYIYPDVKSFNSALGNATQKAEQAMAMGLKSYNVLNAYIICDDVGDIHVVLPSNRSYSTYEAYFVEIMALVLCNYDNKFKSPEGAKMLVRDSFKMHAAKLEQQEAEKEKREQEEEEEAQRQRLEEEEKLQKELEEAEEEERLELLKAQEEEREEKLSQKTEDFIEELVQKADSDSKVDKEQSEKFLQFFLLYKAAKFHKTEYIEAYANYMKTHKLLTLRKIKKADLKQWQDQCTMALQIEYIINRFGYKAFAEYCWKSCDKDYSSEDLYRDVFGVPRIRIEQDLKEYCKIIVKKELPQPEDDAKEDKGEEKDKEEKGEDKNKNEKTSPKSEYPKLVWFVVFNQDEETQEISSQSGEIKSERIR